MNVADKIVQILENEGIQDVFGIPGEQIMPLYKSLSTSTINHILTRHEQAAAHAADGYSRASGKVGVCITTASPGVLNTTMAVATAYKDNVPILVISGENELKYRGSDYFQSTPQQNVLSHITQEAYNPNSPEEAIFDIKMALHTLKNNPKGPVYISLSKDILMSEEFRDVDISEVEDYDLSNLGKACELINKSEKPLFILGAGAIDESDIITEIVDKYQIPVTTTFHGKGIVSDDNPLNLGLCGVRSNLQAKYAFDNADCIIALGIKASERTLPYIPDNLIHVNINREVLVGECPIHGKVSDFLSAVEFKATDWFEEISEIDSSVTIEGLDDNRKPQSAIKRILDRFSDNIVISDAGAHTTWTTLLKKSLKPRQLLFSGGMAPMGYGLPAAMGANVATGEKIIVINGDGDFQMNLQELITLKENNMDVIVFIINNSEFGIIKQWQEDFYDMDPYQVYLNNPDFVKLASSYGIDGVRVENLDDLEMILDKNLTGPLVIDVVVQSEKIPLPK